MYMITISNKIRVHDPPDPIKDAVIEKLTLKNPEYEEALMSGRRLYGIEPYIMNFHVLPGGDILVPRGIRLWLIERYTSVGELKIRDERTLREYEIIEHEEIEYMPYQYEAVKQLVSTAPEGILVSPAGSGKTIMGLSLLPITGQKTLWLTHTNVLAEQVIKRVTKFLPDVGEIGRIGGGKKSIGPMFTVAMVQTLSRNSTILSDLCNEFGLVIIDECHHCPARTFTEVVSGLNPYFLYGLTATPDRRDGLQHLMFQSIGESTVVSTHAVHRHGGIIMPTVLCRFVNTQNLDTNNIQYILKTLMYDKKRNSQIISDVIKEFDKGHKCLVISSRKEHCEILFKILKEKVKGVSVVTGDYSRKVVQERINIFSRKRIPQIMVATFDLIGEGFDVPDIDRAFLALPLRSDARIKQLIGRIQRPSPGKKDAILFDYVDSGVGVLVNQFKGRKQCRYRSYMDLGINVRNI